MADRWFKIKGQPAGERTLAEQIIALAPALAECAGKTVADFGCAEGLIALEFAKAGARSVSAYDYNATFINVANGELAKAGSLPVRFAHADLAGMARETKPRQYDIVLALGVIHKLESPEIGLRFVARSAASLLLIRSGQGAKDGVIRAKHWPHNRCDSRAVLHEEKFFLESVVSGPTQLEEGVEYWRRRGNG